MKNFLCAIAAAFMIPTVSNAQSFCAPSEVVEEGLYSKYGESIVRRGLQDSNTIYEWWENSESGTWTVVRRTADGISCVMTSGNHVHKPLSDENPEGDPT